MVAEILVFSNCYNEITGLYLNPKVEGANIKIWFRNYEWLKTHQHEVNIYDIDTLKSKRISKHNVN